MRVIGHLEKESQARTFADFLYVQGIDNQLDFRTLRAGRFGSGRRQARFPHSCWQIFGKPTTRAIERKLLKAAAQLRSPGRKEPGAIARIARTAATFSGR